MELLRGIRHLLHAEGYTIKGVQKILREQGIDHVKQYGRAVEDASAKSEQKHGKRGRPPVEATSAVSSRSPLPVRAPENAIAVAKAGAPRGRVSPAESQAIIEAAIRELEA